LEEINMQNTTTIPFDDAIRQTIENARIIRKEASLRKTIGKNRGMCYE